MSETELMLYILTRVPYLKIYQDEIEDVYIAEFHNIGKTEWASKTNITYGGLLEDIATQLAEWYLP